MTRVPALRAEVEKELRALLPGWSACVLALLAAAALRDQTILDAAVLASALGAIILGAQAIGHEYTNRTLTVLLAQPLDRWRLLLIKLSVLAVAILALTLIAWDVQAPVAPATWRGSIWHQPEILGIAALCGFFLAPSWTMVSRNPIAGAVFSIFTVFFMVIVVDILATGIYGYDAAAIDRFRHAALWWGMVAACGIGAFTSWRLFARLEAIEGHAVEVRLPRWLARTGSTPRALSRRTPLWLLIRKELRLQQMTFVVAALYPLFAAAILLLGRSTGDAARVVVAQLSLICSVVLALLTGALASAEERRFGTLETQLLLPVPMREQWGVKVGVTIGMTLVLATALTFLVLWPSGFPIYFRGLQLSFWRDAAITLTLLTSCSLYVSSVSNSGVRALVLSIPVVFAGVLISQLAQSVVWWIVYYVVLPVRPPTVPPATYFWQLGDVRSAIHLAWFATSIALVATLLYFALVNHRSSELSVARTLRQVSFVVVLLIAGVLGGGILAAYLR